MCENLNLTLLLINVVILVGMTYAWRFRIKIPSHDRLTFIYFRLLLVIALIILPYNKRAGGV